MAYFIQSLKPADVKPVSGYNPRAAKPALGDFQRVPGRTARLDRDEMMSFWMKNTLVPLSIAYIAQDGRILEIHDMQPEDLTPVRSSRSARYALEVPQGWYDRAGIAPGDRLDVSGF